MLSSFAVRGIFFFLRWSRAAAHGFGLRSVVFLPFCSLFRVLLTEMNRAEQSRGAESKRNNFVHARKQRIRANEPNKRTETEQKRRADQQAKGKEQKEFWWSDVFALVLCSCADLVLAAVFQCCSCLFGQTVCHGVIWGDTALHHPQEHPGK